MKTTPTCANAILLLLLLAVGAWARPLWAESSEPEQRADDQFDFMNLLTRHHLHDLEDEQWNLYGQLTWISSFKLPFRAPYTDLNGSSNSLRPGFEHSFTATVTLFLGTKLWRGAEVYWVPELISERPLSNLTGLGGVIQNFELQKQGSEVPTPYSSRLYYRQTFDLGGDRLTRTSDPMQVATTVARRRLVLTLGNFSILDVFDHNSYAGDLRRQFFNMSFLTYAAYDFGADARGYTWGATLELFFDDWAARFGHIVVPKDPNQLPLDFQFWRYFGEQVELEHAHTLWGLGGTVRLLGYLNREDMGRFGDAIAAWQADPTKNAAGCGARFHYGSTNGGAPDLCWVRRPNLKLGIGASLEQQLYRDLGLFVRGMYSDGRTEVYSYGSTDRSLSLGLLARGGLWRRRRDYAGVGFSAGWISTAHAQYLALGGVDGFVGDGRLTQAAETVLETFYGVNLFSSIWLSGDYQFIAHPGFNGDRGPVHVLGVRLHAEF